MKSYNYHINILFIITAFLLIGFAGCSKDDDGKDVVIPNQEEVITTLHYKLVPASGGDTAKFTFLDLDGEGGNAPTIVADTLMANTTYNGLLVLLNESEMPIGNINTEIEAEAEDHQFFFEPDVNGVTVNYADADANGNPLGIKTVLTTVDPVTGRLKITLRHQPSKDAAGVADGNIANAGGETDIEVTFDLIVQ